MSFVRISMITDHLPFSAQEILPASPHDDDAKKSPPELPGAQKHDNWTTETIIINGLPQTIIFPEG